MTSQNNDSRISINKISNYVLSEQSIDIKSYTTGHLNENHLWKPPAQKFHKPWETSNLSPRKNEKMKSPTMPRIQSSVNNNREGQHEMMDKNIESMRQTLFDFSIGAKLMSLNKLMRTSISTTNESNKTTESVKLPLITKPIENVRQSLSLPLSDKEIALNMLNNPFKGATKEEKFKNIVKFEKEVLRKDDLLISNVLHSTESISNLEARFKEELSKLTSNENITFGNKINLQRLDLVNNIFDDLIKESKLYGDILSRIKNEYDDYLFTLLRNQNLENINNSLTDESYELMKDHDRKQRKFELERELEDIEGLIDKFTDQNQVLKKKIEAETEFNTEKTHELNQSLSKDASKAEEKMLRNQKLSIGDKIEHTKMSIIEKIDSLNSLNEKLRKDYVPSVVINNLNQTIKDIEIETHKIIEQNKYLHSQELELENQLKNFLIKNDKTEFASENVEYLIKSIKNFDVLKMNNNKRTDGTPQLNLNSTINDQSNNNQTQQTDSTNKYFENLYDDYFS